MKKLKENLPRLLELKAAAGSSRPLVDDHSPKADAARRLAWALFDLADEVLLESEPVPLNANDSLH